MSYVFVELDTGSTLEVTCKKKATGAVLDLTGFIDAKLRYKINRSAVQEKTMAFDADRTTGKVTYKFLTGELIQGGSMKAEVRLTDGGGFVLTSLNNFVGPVKRRLA